MTLPRFVFSFSVPLTICMACSDPSSAGYDRIGISVSEAVDGPSSAPVLFCFTPPILLGSEVTTEYPFENGVTLVVTGSHEQLSIYSTGSASDGIETVPVKEAAGRSFELSAEGGASYLVELQAGCF